MCHNGEINMCGNKNGCAADLIESDYFGDDMSQILPVTSENMSDSGNMDAVMEMAVKAGQAEPARDGGEHEIRQK